MSDKPPVSDPVSVDIGAWIERGRANPTLHLERQATELLLAAIARTETLKNSVFLKGGVLMGVAYGSPRQTGDVDFTTTLAPTPENAQMIEDALNGSLRTTAPMIGYPDLLARVQSRKLQPHKKFGDAFFPALSLKIGYTRRNSADAARFEAGQASRTLPVDISFNEPVFAFQILRDHAGDIRAYALAEVIAEKLRSLLQQPIRNRNRRQDVYDIDHLIGRFPLDDTEKAELLRIFLEKCLSRGIEPAAASFAAPEVRERAEADWESLGLEISDLPAFDDCFARVEAFYRSLPWRD